MSLSNVLLIISGLPQNISYLLSDLTVEECFCEPLYGKLTLLSVRAIGIEMVLNSRVSIKVNDNKGHKRYFHGFVSMFRILCKRF